MLDKAKERGFKPKFVMFDIWYASVENLKASERSNGIF
jgi:putative transposase